MNGDKFRLFCTTCGTELTDELDPESYENNLLCKECKNAQ